MDTYLSDFIRIGTSLLGAKPLSNLRKMMIYGGTAFHSTASESVTELLNSKTGMRAGVDCPRLIVSAVPSCSELYFHLKMTAGEIDGGQSVLDSSGNGNHAINGNIAGTTDPEDCDE